MSKYICPKCNIPLITVKASHGVFWRCDSCDGRSITLSLLRKSIPANVINELWQTARTGSFPRHCICPSCRNRMAEVPAATEHGVQVLDVCTVCQFVWFDYNEYAALPSIPMAPSWEETLPQDTREKLAMLEVEAIRSKAERDNWGTQAPDAWWHWIVGIIGMPVEHDAERIESLPWITWTLAGLIVAVSVIGFSDLQNTVNSLGLIPAQFGRYSGLTFLTSFFLHGGLLHLIGNIYFLIVFGDNVEDCLGKWKFFFLVACAALIGDLTHILGNPSSIIPCIGASGGISGVMAFYALKFPKVKLRFLMRFLVVFRWVSLPAYSMFLIWMALQCFGVGAQLKGYSNVSSLAHLGGAGVGFVFWLLSRETSQKTEPRRRAETSSPYLRKYRD